MDLLHILLYLALYLLVGAAVGTYYVQNIDSMIESNEVDLSSAEQYNYKLLGFVFSMVIWPYAILGAIFRKH
jgi:hypothetical protein